MPIIDKTKEEAGRGYQILGAVIPDNQPEHNTPTFWHALSDGASGLEKWFNIFTNSVIVIALIFFIFYIIYNIFYFLFRLILFLYRLF